MIRHRFKFIVGLLVLLVGYHCFYLLKSQWFSDGQEVGTALDALNGVTVYANGPLVSMIYGFSYGPDGYFYGYKWQCVEFIRRYYANVLGHQMPNGFKHAKYYYDPELAQGELNPDFNLIQYKNGSSEKPQVNDILVYDYSPFGHVAVVSKVKETSIEVIQQNRYPTREILSLTEEEGNYLVQPTITSRYPPKAWLRMEANMTFQLTFKIT